MSADDLIFTTHAKERGLLRILGKQGPYSGEEYRNIEALVRLNVKWCALRCKWVLDDFGLELITLGNRVLTIKKPAKAYYQYDKMAKREIK